MKGDGSGRIDKNYFSFFGYLLNYHKPKIEYDGHWKHGIIYLSGQYGYYGCSSAYDVISPEIVEVICDACNTLEKHITQKAIDILKAKKKEIACKIEADAKLVLNNLKESQNVKD